MKTSNSQTAPQPPRIVPTLIAGFDVITKHIGLILFPVGLDMLIWLMPHLRMKNMIDAWTAKVFQPISDTSDMAQIASSAQEIWTFMAERFNLLITLRSYPVGIPSLMVSNLPLRFPGGEPLLIEIPSLGVALLLAGFLTLVGIICGALYFAFVAKAVIHDEIRLLKTLSTWPQVSLQIILLTLVWLAILLGICVPASCSISFLIMVGISVGPIAIFIFGGLLLWLAFPLLFSPHGIFVNQDSMWASVKKSVQIIRMTLPTTATFFISIGLLSQGLDMLWRIPADDSWLMLISVVGHAFVSTGFLSASFIYYQKADEWVQNMMEKIDQMESEAEAVA
ncbi:MAG: hypothetical protein U9Q82_12075 [Chloroflexota bacterium]|nr:hypothetical protein [Chloroflexota bacterium]